MRRLVPLWVCTSPPRRPLGRHSWVWIGLIGALIPPRVPRWHKGQYDAPPANCDHVAQTGRG